MASALLKAAPVNTKDILRVLKNLSGAGMIALDTLTECDLAGGKSNPYVGRATKLTLGSRCTIYQNKFINGYAAKVERQLIKEGKDPSNFVLQPRTWGERAPGLPIITHTPEGTTEVQYYLEVVFLGAGTSTYFVDGKEWSKGDMIDIARMKVSKPKPDSQGGVDKKVIIRGYGLDSVLKIRFDGQEFEGPFTCNLLEDDNE